MTYYGTPNYTKEAYCRRCGKIIKWTNLPAESRLNKDGVSYHLACGSKIRFNPYRPVIKNVCVRV